MASLLHSLSVYSDGSLQAETLARDLWYLKSWQEAGKAGLSVGNFAAVTLYDDPQGVTGGQTNWVRLYGPEIDWIKALNVTSYKSWQWAVSQDGTIYLSPNDEWTTPDVKWPRICIGSSDGGGRNQVNVLQWSGEYCLIQGIPKSDNYALYDQPWLVQTVYVVFPDGHTSPNPWFRMPLWDPASGFETSVGQRGLWLPTKWLYGRV